MSIKKEYKEVKYIGGQENIVNIIESLPSCKREKGININGDGTINIHTSKGCEKIFRGDSIIIDGNSVKVESFNK